ncbi:MAG: ACT domain-containing protein [Acutalibacteraceae bacterium]|nr:ACT domain-containing protein [Acutalibacteraceae bacterium]
MSKKTFYIVDADALPEVYKKVVTAKEMVDNGTAKNISMAIKMCDLSRSAFYKYKDSVFKAKSQDPEKVELQAVLVDRAGVLSAVSNVLFQSGANIITVNQTEPTSGLATVSVVIGTEGLKISLDALVKRIEDLDEVISVKII